jgi:hypothetical protein
MNQFQNFDTSELMDLLARHTQRFTELFTNNELGNEYENCKNMIEELQEEIAYRKVLPSNTSVSDPDISFKAGETTL